MYASNLLTSHQSISIAIKIRPKNNRIRHISTNHMTLSSASSFLHRHDCFVVCSILHALIIQTNLWSIPSCNILNFSSVKWQLSSCWSFFSFQFPFLADHKFFHPFSLEIASPKNPITPLPACSPRFLPLNSVSGWKIEFARLLTLLYCIFKGYTVCIIHIYLTSFTIFYE